MIIQTVISIILGIAMIATGAYCIKLGGRLRNLYLFMIGVGVITIVVLIISILQHLHGR